MSTLTQAQQRMVDRLNANCSVLRPERAATKSGISSSWSGSTGIVVLHPDGGREQAHLNTARSLEQAGIVRRVRSQVPGYHHEWVLADE